MFPMDSIEIMKGYYKEDGNFCEGGIWSFLLTESAEESADFANTYYSIFNNASRSTWHLVVFARGVAKGKGNKITWYADNALQEFGNIIRESLEGSGVRVPPLAIVFFDPEAGPNSNSSCLIIPLDQEKTSDKALFRKTFVGVHSIIVRAFKNMGLGLYDKVPPTRVREMTLEIDAGIRGKKVTAYFNSLSLALGNALFGALVSRAIER